MPSPASATTPTIADQLRIDPRLLKVLADPARSFIVYSLIESAKTVRQLAEEMQCPPTRLYHHMKQLESKGLIRVERTRMVSGIQEKHYRAVARELLMDTSAYVSDGKQGHDSSEALLSFVFDQSRLEIANGIESGQIDLTRRAPEVGALIAYRNVLKLARPQAEALYQRLSDLWMEYDTLAKQPAEAGDFYAFAIALYPNAVGQPADPTAGGKKPGRKPARRRRA